MSDLQPLVASHHKTRGVAMPGLAIVTVNSSL